jgi:hypothetical protein
MRIKEVRHEVARILTILRQREVEAEREAYEAEMADKRVVGSSEEAEALAGGSAKRSFLRKKENR